MLAEQKLRYSLEATFYYFSRSNFLTSDSRTSGPTGFSRNPSTGNQVGSPVEDSNSTPVLSIMDVSINIGICLSSELFFNSLDISKPSCQCQVDIIASSTIRDGFSVAIFSIPSALLKAVTTVYRASFRISFRASTKSTIKIFCSSNYNTNFLFRFFAYVFFFFVRNSEPLCQLTQITLHVLCMYYHSTNIRNSELLPVRLLIEILY